MSTSHPHPDSDRELILERIIDAPPENCSARGPSLSFSKFGLRQGRGLWLARA